MNKLTKIVATIGPATDSEEMIESLINAGVNVFRFNFKHNTVEWHNERIQRVNRVAEKMGTHIGTLIDLQGPEIRINMPVEEIKIQKGDLLLFGEIIFENKKEKGFSISHPEIIQYLKDGQKLVADDGAFTFYVHKENKRVYLRSDTNGTLKQRKSLNIPGADFPFPVLVDRDFDGLQLAARNEIDFVALSFVRTVEDLKTVRTEMDKYKVGAKLVAKIETQKALDNLDEIIAEADVLMVARGDLGVELPVEQVPYYQKLIIKKCLERGIPVITATQMLQSMIEYSYPTRAEVSDIANATYDLTDAVMLSGETATGQYPVETVNAMSKTAEFNEKKMEQDTRNRFHYVIRDQVELISEAAYNIYLRSPDHDVIQAFVVLTISGKTAQLISRYRPQIPIYAVTPTKKVADSLSINYGVYAVLTEELHIDNKEVLKEDILNSIRYLINNHFLVKGRKVIVLHGDVWGISGGTSSIKMVTV